MNVVLELTEFELFSDTLFLFCFLFSLFLHAETINCKSFNNLDQVYIFPRLFLLTFIIASAGWTDWKYFIAIVTFIYFVSLRCHFWLENYVRLFDLSLYCKILRLSSSFIFIQHQRTWPVAVRFINTFSSINRSNVYFSFYTFSFLFSPLLMSFFPQTNLISGLVP